MDSWSSTSISGKRQLSISRVLAGTGVLAFVLVGLGVGASRLAGEAQRSADDEQSAVVATGREVANGGTNRAEPNQVESVAVDEPLVVRDSETVAATDLETIVVVPSTRESATQDSLTETDRADLTEDESVESDGSDPQSTRVASESAPVSEEQPVDRPSEPVASDPESSADFSTDFSSIDPSWEVYNSVGHAGTGLRRPSAVSVHSDPSATGGSVLKITAEMGSGPNAGQIVSGGLSFPAAGRTYGRYTFRVRVEKDPTKVTSAVAVLWPTSGRWPEEGEVNMFETWNHRDTRMPIEFNVHWLNPSATEPYVLNDTRALQVSKQIDGSQWHTYTYEWTPDRLSVSVDGGPLMTIMDDPTKIPHWDMTPTFQLDPFAPTGNREATPKLTGPVSMYIDFLRVESLN